MHDLEHATDQQRRANKDGAGQVSPMMSHQAKSSELHCSRGTPSADLDSRAYPQ